MMIMRLGHPLVDDNSERRHFTMGKILEYLNKNFTREISLDELSRMAICSPRTFRRKFKSLTGYAVTDYITRPRGGRLHRHQLL